MRRALSAAAREAVGLYPSARCRRSALCVPVPTPRRRRPTGDRAERRGGSPGGAVVGARGGGLCFARRRRHASMCSGSISARGSANWRRNTGSIACAALGSAGEDVEAVTLLNAASTRSPKASVRPTDIAAGTKDLRRGRSRRRRAGSGVAGAGPGAASASGGRAKTGPIERWCKRQRGPVLFWNRRSPWRRSCGSRRCLAGDKRLCPPSAL